MYTVISETENGKVFICPSCDNIHFEYKNLNFNFESMRDYQYTAEYFLRLNGKQWEERNDGNFFNRKIFIPIGHKNFHILLNNDELNELKILFSKKTKKTKKSIDLSHFAFNEN